MCVMRFKGCEAAQIKVEAAGSLQTQTRSRRKAGGLNKFRSRCTESLRSAHLYGQVSLEQSEPSESQRTGLQFMDLTPRPSH